MYYGLNSVLDCFIYQISKSKAHICSEELFKTKNVQIYVDISGGSTQKYSFIQTLVMCFIQTLNLFVLILKTCLPPLFSLLSDLPFYCAFLETL